MEIASLEMDKGEQKLLSNNNNLIVSQQSFICDIDCSSHCTGVVLWRTECRKENGRRVTAIRRMLQNIQQLGTLNSLTCSSLFGSTANPLGGSRTM